jgi:hypothetical protein
MITESHLYAILVENEDQTWDCSLVTSSMDMAYNYRLENLTPRSRCVAYEGPSYRYYLTLNR